MNMYLTLQNPTTRIQNALKIGWSAILFIAIWLGISLSALAQPQYSFTAVSGTFTPITGGTTAGINADDVISAALPIGFTFVYDGVARTQFKVSSNGWLTFNTAATLNAADNGTGAASTTTGLANLENTIRPLLAPFWDDLDGRATGGSNASYVTTGSSPNRILTMEWLNWEWRFNNTLPTISFQVKLYEATGVVEYIYRQEPNASNVTTTNGASIGLTKSTTGSGQYFSLNNASATPTVSSTASTNTINAKPATGQIYRWTPNFVPVQTVSPADNTTNVALTTNLSIGFAYPATPPTVGTGTIELYKTTSNILVESFDAATSTRISISGNNVVIDPTNVLECNTEYYVLVPATAIGGVGFTGITTTAAWSFITTQPSAILEFAASTALPLPIPDATPAGVNNTQTITNTSIINNLTVAVAINHTWVGDIIVTLTHVTSGTSVILIDRMGVPLSTIGCSQDNFNVILSDAATLPIESQCAAGLTGTFTPNNPLSAFNGLALNSDWKLNVSDNGATDTGSLISWKLIVPSTELPLTATFSPADEATSVALNTNLVLDFPYPVSAGTGDITIYDVTTGTILETIPVGDARVTFSGGQVTINPSLNLPSNTPIALQFPTGTFISCNNLNIVGIIDNTTWNFTTVDCSALTIDAGTPQSTNPNTLVSLNAVAVGADPSATYSWTPTTGLSDSTIANPTIANLTATTTYTVTVTNPNGCQASDDVLITSNCDALLIDAGATQSVASNSTVTFAGTATGGSGNYMYSWSPGVGLSDSTVSNPTFAGFTVATTFTLTVTDVTTGCIKTDNVVIGITPPGGGGGGGAVTPTVTAPLLRVTSLNSTSIRLNWSGSNATQYLVFRKGGTSTNFALLLSTSNVSTLLDSMLMPNTHYSYYVQAVISGITANSNIASDYTYPSAPRVASFQNACLGTGAQLTVKGSTGVYNVYSSATGGNAIVSSDSTRVITTPTFTDSATFYVSAIGTRYESSPRVAVHVITRPLPTATMLGASLQESCTDMLTIMAQAVEGATYTWYSSDVPLATTSTPMYTVNRSGIYSVLVNKEGCVARSNTIRVRVNVLTPAKITGLANRQFCEGGTLDAIQTDSAMYEWQRDNTVVGTGSSLEVTQSGNYTVTVTSVLGCVLTSEAVSVTVISVPQLDLQTSDSAFCSNSDGVELTVNAVSGATYEWLRNGRRIRITSIPSLKVNTGGEYRVRVLLNETCSRTSDPVTVIRNDAPTATTRVYGDSIKVVYVGNVAIQSITWTKDGTPFSATTQAFAPTESGLYIPTVTYATGCVVVSSGVNYIKIPDIVTGEEGVEALGFMLFPNPTVSKVNIAFGDAFKGDITLTLTDAIGRVIQVVQVKATGNATIDLSTVANGTYMLTIASKDKVITRKIIRE